MSLHARVRELERRLVRVERDAGLSSSPAPGRAAELPRADVLFLETVLAARRGDEPLDRTARRLIAEAALRLNRGVGKAAAEMLGVNGVWITRNRDRRGDRPVEEAA